MQNIKNILSKVLILAITFNLTLGQNVYCMNLAEKTEEKSCKIKDLIKNHKTESGIIATTGTALTINALRKYIAKPLLYLLTIKLNGCSEVEYFSLSEGFKTGYECPNLSTTMAVSKQVLLNDLIIDTTALFYVFLTCYWIVKKIRTL